jgi:putative sugar O-methyltransferase
MKNSNIIYLIKWIIRRVFLIRKELLNVYQTLIYQPQSRFILSADTPKLPYLESVKFYAFLGRVGFGLKEFIALISNGKIFKKSILLDGFDEINLKELYEKKTDITPFPKPPLVELDKKEKLKNEDLIFTKIEKSYYLANSKDPNRFSRANWWEEMSKKFQRELFNSEGINRKYLKRFRVEKELPANLVRDQFLIVNREFGYFKSYLKAIDLVLEYHRLAKIVPKEILINISESYAGDNLCVNYRGQRLSIRNLFHAVIVENILRKTELPRDKKSAIWEIGAGYGALSRILKEYIPNSCYIILDLPETLTYASYFISYNFEDKKIGYLCDIIDRLENFQELLDEFDFLIVPTWVSEYIPKDSINLIIDTYSMGEMSKEYVEYYLTHIDRTLKRGGYFYSINRRFNRTDENLGFYYWKLESRFLTLIYEQSKYIHPQWLGRKV